MNYMNRFGFNQDPPLDYPDGQMKASGVRNAKGQLLDGDDGFDVGRVAIGQGGDEGQIQVTPLQMAMVAGGGGQRRRADAAAADREDRRARTGGWRTTSSPRSRRR